MKKFKKLLCLLALFSTYKATAYEQRSPSGVITLAHRNQPDRPNRPMQLKSLHTNMKRSVSGMHEVIIHLHKDINNIQSALKNTELDITKSKNKKVIEHLQAKKIEYSQQLYQTVNEILHKIDPFIAISKALIVVENIIKNKDDIRPSSDNYEKLMKLSQDLGKSEFASDIKKIASQGYDPKFTEEQQKHIEGLYNHKKELQDLLKKLK